MDLLIPPPIVTALCAVMTWLVGRFVPLGGFEFPHQRLVAIGLLIAAALLMMVAAAQFLRARTTINPMRPGKASSLMTTGVFAFSRNPIYLADLLVLVGIATWIGHLVGFLPCILFVAYMNRFQIRPEESTLTALFGDDYRRYRERVRRWI